MSPGAALLVGFLLLAVNAVLVAAELAVVSARRSSVEPLAATSRRARTVLWAMRCTTLVLACARLGTIVCATGAGAVTGPALARLLEGPLTGLGLPQPAASVAGLVLALGLVVTLHVVLGVAVPKALAAGSPERTALRLGPLLVAATRVLSPLVRALGALADLALRPFGVEPRREVASALTAEEVAAVIERSQRQGVLQDELGLLSGALELSGRSAAEVMVPDERLVTLEDRATPEDVETAVARTGFSRFPVRNLDGGVHGYLHVKDVLYADGPLRARPVPHWRVRALPEVAPSDEIEEVLTVMQRTGTHLAGVGVPEGPTIGVVFLEDILEELVGDVSDSMQRHSTAS